MVCYRIHLIELFLVYLVKAINHFLCVETARVPVGSRVCDGDRPKHVGPDFLCAGGRQALVHLLEYRSRSRVERLI
jgi:hypothetical protein